MSSRLSTYRVSLRLYVIFSLLMAASAAASGLLLVYLARPFISQLPQYSAADARMLLFTGAGLAGAAAAVAGLLVGLRLAVRIRGIVRKADALVPPATGTSVETVRDELGALDAAMGRLTLSMDQFVRDSDILSRLPEGMLLLLPAGELLSFNTTAQVLLGISLERFRGADIFSAGGVFPNHKGNEALVKLVSEAAAGKQSLNMSEAVVTTANGQGLLLEATVQHRDWQNSSALVLLFRDASEKQRIREEIRRADQLALLGGVAARVAHEIRTPLSTIRGLLELLEGDLVASDSTREYMKRILKAVDRQDRLVENLLTLSNPEPETWQPLSIPQLIEDVLEMLPSDQRIRVTGLDNSLPSAWGDAFRLSEVFTNLVQNALEATPVAGTVDVAVEAVSAERVRVSVRNTGAGIAVDLRERIFQPFFTTKSRGTGLGLAIARHIIDAHHGTLQVSSDGASEATFTVELPTVAPRVADPA
jgi:PAS domain S-box-containing protein